MNMKQKAGQKGNFRMNRSLALNLSNPELSLCNALTVSGFDLPEIDDNY